MVNYVIRELIKKGYVKAERFKNSNNKAAYIYALTPQGINARVKQTQFFLEKKVLEYEKLKLEIDELKKIMEIRSTLHQDETIWRDKS